MKFCEAFGHFNYKSEAMKSALGISLTTLYRWRSDNAIPYDKQCLLQILTNGELVASLEHIRKKGNKNVQVKNG